MNTSLRTTPLYEEHRRLGARLVEFGGWHMPVQYSSIPAEHAAARAACGLFDVSHMGRLVFSGAESVAWLDGLLTRGAAPLPKSRESGTPGRIRYSLIPNERGGIRDDVLVYHLRDSVGEPYHMLVVNAGNREKIVAHLEARRPPEIGLEDRTETTAMIAVQGPRALEVAEPLVSHELASLKYYTGVWTTLTEGGAVLASRTGYTGEDGVELIVAAEHAAGLWRQLVERATAVGGGAVGLGARDTLRLEAGMPLYGHELSEEIDPWQAGLAFAVDWEERDFLGRDALSARRGDSKLPVRVGLELAGRRAAREGYAVYLGAEQIGEVSSGTFSPTLQKSIAMAYVEPSHAVEGARLEVDIRGTRVAAVVVPLPFYRRIGG